MALPDTADKRIDRALRRPAQRVAIARALAVEPAVLLLDEPLSALDLKLRQHMRAELRAIQKRTGVTFIYITHDQGEALTMSDRVGVMSRGVHPAGGRRPDDLRRPGDAFVASFVGETNLFHRPRRRRRGRRAGPPSRPPAGTLIGRARATCERATRRSLFVRPERMRPPMATADHEHHRKPGQPSVEFEGPSSTSS